MKIILIKCHRKSYGKSFVIFYFHFTISHLYSNNFYYYDFFSRFIKHFKYFVKSMEILYCRKKKFKIKKFFVLSQFFMFSTFYSIASEILDDSLCLSSSKVNEKCWKKFVQLFFQVSKY